MIVSSNLVFYANDCYIHFSVNQEDSSGEADIRPMAMTVTAEMFAYAHALNSMKNSQMASIYPGWMFEEELGMSLRMKIKRNYPEYRASDKSSKFWTDLIDHCPEQIFEEIQEQTSKLLTIEKNSRGIISIRA